MNSDKYPVIIGESNMTFEFMSTGRNGHIPKLVIYSKTKFPNVYNLAFGDKDIKSGLINDKVISNNGDSNKVLRTVASTLYTFMKNFPKAKVFATGSTRARTRLYRIGINNNWDEIKDDFLIFGLLHNEWQTFKKDIEYEAFLVERKTVNLQHDETEKEKQ